MATKKSQKYEKICKMFIYITKPAFFRQKSRWSKIVIKWHKKCIRGRISAKPSKIADLALMPSWGLSYSSSAIRVVSLSPNLSAWGRITHQPAPSVLQGLLHQVTVFMTTVSWWTLIGLAESARLELASPEGRLVSTEVSYQLELTLQRPRYLLKWTRTNILRILDSPAALPIKLYPHT